MVPEGQFAALYERRIRALRQLVRRRAGQGVLGGVSTALVSGAVLGLLILFVSQGEVSLAGAGAAAAALILLGTQLQGLASGVGQLYESALFIQDFNNFVQTELAPGTSAFTGTAPLPAHIGHLSVRDLTFTYPSRQAPSLRDVNIDIGAGQVVALVGENGSGKTTLAKLLAGYTCPRWVASAGTGRTWPAWTSHRSANGWPCCSRTMSSTSCPLGKTSR